ncbi:MAG: kynureninase [Flavobacteriales bacterium]|jgi:kynureninase|nr:kynureninase [Flavobacteriales bacterium]
MKYTNSLAFAKELDAKDPLKDYRKAFIFPSFTDKPVVYFTGNSLGLQPKSVKAAINTELDDWGKWGVEGHFEAQNPWVSYHELLTEKTARLVGALPKEVVVTHSLTTNLHLLMISFYQPQGKRNKIICEKKAFPSDQYAIQSQAKLHGFQPEEVIIEVGPRAGEHLIREEDILAKIKETGDELAMIMIGGVNYYSGQVFDMKAITEAGHKVGAKVGFDLAHAAGNIKLELNNWGVDFATWCSYKYLNSSPGGVSGLYINEKHVDDENLLRLAGWWGHNKEQRFLMADEFQPIPTAESWQLSNAPVIAMAIHNASLSIFDEVGMDALIEKRDQLTGYLEFIINDISSRYENVNFEIITPRAPLKRGAQLSILAHGKGKELFNFIAKEGVVADWREPNVIRIAPAPLYNNYEDVYRFGKILEEALR